VKYIQVAAFAALLAAAQAQAQTIPAEDFAKRPEAWEVALSPSGKHAALTVPTADGMETQLQILELATGKTQVLRFGRQQHVTDIVWTADEQVVVSRAKLQPFKARPTTIGELMTSDIRGKNQDILFGYIPDDGTKRGRRKDEGWSVVAKVLDDQPGMALVDFTCWNCGDEPDTVIFKVNTLTGVRQEVERGDKLAWYAFDRTGKARVRKTIDDDDTPVLHYRKAGEDAWTPLPKTLAGYNMNLSSARFAADGNILYALASDGLEPMQAYRIDLAAGTRTKLAGRADVEISGFMYQGRDGAPFAVTYDADKPSLQYIQPDSEWAKLHAGLMKAFPGQMLTFNSYSRDGNTVLFSAWSDRNIGSYYVYDRVAKRAQKLIDYKPWLTPETMVQMRPVEFSGKDGEKLFGFYTAKGPGPHPLVVMPHGGPIGPYDTWHFDSDAQFLASRGYAVLQVNFRGSGGRGEAFERAGWKQWGGTIQDDITAGVQWAIANKLADKDRICLYGASFGGYSALMQPILHPGMYKCAIGYVGVYDLAMLRKDWTEGGNQRRIRINDRTHGNDPTMLAGWSPALRAGEVKIPVFLIHGSDDQTAAFSQYKSMNAALLAAGNTPETFVVAGEGHGFVKPENITELYKRMEIFLGKHIGPGAK
jgi:dipeptidyl aminopeptidase/acylaminoacyl peptidase